MADKKDETQGAETPDEAKLPTDTSSESDAISDQDDIVDANFEEIRDEPSKDEDPIEDTSDVDDAVEEPMLPADAPEVLPEDVMAEPEILDTPETDEAEPDPEPTEPPEVPEPAMPVPQETVIEKTVIQKRGFVPVFLGGVIAAGLGFVAARIDLPPGVEASLPAALRNTDYAEPISALETKTDTQASQINETGQRLTDLSAQIDTTESKITDLESRLTNLDIPDIAPLTSSLDALGSDLEAARAEAVKGIEDLTLRLDSLDVRVSGLEKRPITENLSDEAIAAYERELDGVRRALSDERDTVRAEFDALIAEQGERLTAAVDAEKARIDQMLTDAQKMVDDAHTMADKTAMVQQEAMKSQRLAAAQSAVAIIRGAFAEGDAYADKMGPLTEAGIEIPPALSAPAEDGVPTHGALLAEFPPAARDALDASRYSDPEATKGLGAFLQRQLGARSTTPQEGDSTDAILSRAEAALKREDLSTALIELEALSDEAAAKMSGWVDLATMRRDALEALDSVAADLNTN